MLKDSLWNLFFLVSFYKIVYTKRELEKGLLWNGILEMLKLIIKLC